MSTASSNKAKIARRVVEVLEFFDDNHPQATVMDIVRRYDRPQSSTSELLSSLVELGILYKDCRSRSYRPTPRAAMLGAMTQAPLVRDGRLMTLLDRLHAQTGLPVALFGFVGVHAQVFNCRSSKTKADERLIEALGGGCSERLTETVVGQLLLSTLSRPRREGIVRRLNAEAQGQHLPYSEMLARIDDCERKGRAKGASGFGLDMEMCAALLPAHAVDQAMAIGFVYSPSSAIDSESLAAALTSAINSVIEDGDAAFEATPLVAAA